MGSPSACNCLPISAVCGDALQRCCVPHTWLSRCYHVFTKSWMDEKAMQGLCGAGAKVVYLEPFYADFDGPRQQVLAGKGLYQFISREARGTGVPRPFSCRNGPLRGIAENLNIFFFGQRPYPYSYQQPLPNKC